MSFGRCNLAHPSHGIHRGAESAAAAAAAAATAASSCASTIGVFLRVNHEFLTMRGLWRVCGRRSAGPGTRSHAPMVSREMSNQYLWSHVQRVPAVSVWQHCRPADTRDSLLTMPHKSKKDKVKLFSCAFICQNLARLLVLFLMSFNDSILSGILQVGKVQKIWR